MFMVFHLCLIHNWHIVFDGHVCGLSFMSYTQLIRNMIQKLCIMSFDRAIACTKCTWRQDWRLLETVQPNTSWMEQCHKNKKHYLYLCCTLHRFIIPPVLYWCFTPHFVSTPLGCSCFSASIWQKCSWVVSVAKRKFKDTRAMETNVQSEYERFGWWQRWNRSLTMFRHIVSEAKSGSDVFEHWRHMFSTNNLLL